MTEPEDEQSLFESAVNDEPAEVPVVEETIEPEAEAEEEPVGSTEPKEGRIPKWRRDEIAAEKNRAVDEARDAREELARERTARSDLERRLAAAEKPSKAEEEPDPLLDPKGYRDFIRAETQKEILSERRETSLQSAHGKYKEEFEEAYAAAQKGIDPSLKAKMQMSRDPGETLIQWHREQKTMREVGTDPNAWLEKKLEERLADPAFLAKAIERAKAPSAQNGRPRVELPPSLNGASRASAAVRSGDDLTDEQLFAETTG